MLRFRSPAEGILMGAVLSLIAASAHAQRVSEALEAVEVRAARGTGTLNLNRAADTGSRTAPSIEQTPASVDIIEQSTFQDRNATTVVDALRGVTGLTGVVRAGAAGIFQSRGFNDNAVSIQFDGIRIGASTLFTRPYDSFSFDRIEVLRGPGSALHGDSAVGGAINYVRRKPVSGPITGEAIASFGSYNDRRLGAAIGGSLGENTSFATSIVTRSNDTFVRGESSDSLQWVGSLAYRFTPQTRLLIEADYWRRSVDNAYWGTPLVAGQIDRRLYGVNYNVAPDNRYQDDTLWLRARLQTQLSDQWTSSTQLYRYSANRDWKNFYNPSFNTATQLVSIGIAEDLAYDNTVVGLRQEFSRTKVSDPMAIRAVMGLDWQNSKFASPRFSGSPVPAITTLDPFNPMTLSFAGSTPARNQFRGSDVTTLALFGEITAPLTSATALNAAARIDRLDVDVRNGAIANPPQGSAQFSTATYRLGASHRVAPGHTLYAHYSTGTEPPDSSAFAFFGVTGPAFQLQNLRLTEARQIEVGSKHRVVAWNLEMTTALYDIERENILTADPANPSGPRLQIGQQQSRGIELAAAWRATRQLTLSGNLSLLDASYGSFVAGGLNATGNRPRLAPSSVVNLGVNYRPSGQWELALFGRRISSVFVNDQNTQSIPAIVNLDGFVRFRVSRSTDLTLSIQNIADRKQAEWALPNAGGIVLFAPPRTATLGVRTAL